MVARAVARAAMKQTTEAVALFDQARALQSMSLEGASAHAATLMELQCKVGYAEQPAQLAQLSKLAQQLLRIDQKRAAPWVASSYFCSASAASSAAQQRRQPGATISGPSVAEQMNTAISYSQRAITLDQLDADALHAHASHLLGSVPRRRPKQGDTMTPRLPEHHRATLEKAAATYRRLLTVEKRLRPYHGLVAVHLRRGRDGLKDSLERAGDALRLWPKCPATYTMMGSVLMAPELIDRERSKARQAFDKALNM